ncbi:LysR family transcriptional regulator [Runella sp.]|jgi:DNA-binding transcriptional LysR family regulator|uniref:LysR family transcriptional regulator n=1 Tax=Runella sp. TaxID=1960881 RepID=UPI0026068ACB|nr:LysR family transcriptional regulator [Runella sp.]
MLSLHHEVFMEVARLRSFTKAGQVLFLSQSAISKHIKSLEYRYKIGLFERHGNSISLTQAGHILYDKLLEAAQLRAELHHELQHINENFLPPTKLAIGSSTTISLYVLPSVLSAYLREKPHIQLSVLNRNSDNIQTALLEHDIDVGIVEGITRVNTLTYTPFTTDDVLAVCSGNSPLRGRILPLTALLEIPLALRENGSGTLAVVEDELFKRGIKQSDLKVLIRLGGTEALKNFVLADTCLAFMPRRAIVKELAAGDLVEVKIEDLFIQRAFHFIQRKGTENNSLVNEFIRFTRHYYSKMD